MDFIPGTLIDTHLSQRGCIGQLITAVAHYQQDLGLGLDENTALVLDGSTFEVVGEGTVTVVDAGGMGFSTPLTRGGATRSRCKTSGCTSSRYGFRFDLAARRPLAEVEKGKIEENAVGAEKAARPKKDEGEGP